MEVVTEDDKGELMHHMGYRLQHNRARGPMKGGILQQSPRLLKNERLTYLSMLSWIGSLFFY